MLLAGILSLVSNLDNLILGLTYGASKIKIKFNNILIISFIVSLATLVFGIIGKSISCIFFPKLANILGGVLLVCIGIYYTLKEYIHKNKCSKEELKNKIFDINKKEVITISLSLSINNIPIALLAAMSGANILFLSIFTFLISTIFLYIGNNVGIKIKNTMLMYVSNTLLIIIGIWQIIESIL